VNGGPQAHSIPVVPARPARRYRPARRSRVVSATVTLDVALRWLLYALVPILTLGVEDNFLTEALGYDLWGGQFSLQRSGVTACDVAGLLLVGLTIPLWFARGNRFYLKVFALLGLAVAVSGVYGRIRGVSSGYALFEPSVWKTLVPLFGLTVAFSRLFEDAWERRRFLSWFCAVQFAFSVFVLGCYLVLGRGQRTYFDAEVPVFAGDMLIFLIIAYGISLFRLAARRSWRDGLYVVVFATVIMLSLRRSFMAAVFSAPLFLLGSAVLRGGTRLRSVKQSARVLLVVLLTFWLFFGYVGPWRLPGDLVAGRVRSVNLLWAESQSDSMYGSMGHTDDFLDGLETVISSPVLGKGLAVWFDLPRTSGWQDANVHAGVFKIWIKLGFLGVVCYLLLFGRGLSVLKDLKRWDDLTAVRLFVVWFALHFIIVSIYMNSIFFGYKNSFVTATYLGLCAALVWERRSAPT